ncbi:MAG: polyketide synthase dehydratase domain-containing protein [Syntrophales bacterium]|nr:polyketide synthase dehydratase domain-containing protein [Syntrophales bacterium]
MKASNASTPPSNVSKPDVSAVKERIRLPLAISIQPYLRDHHYEGKIMFPAVEILQQLAASLQSHRPGAPVQCMRAAAFDRFLPIEGDSAVIDACHELEVHENGRLTSRLMTTGPVAGSTIRRTKVHAVVDFADSGADGPPLPLDIAAALEGIVFEIPARRLYEELVPFGPAYQNITGSLLLSEDGALGQACAADHPAPIHPLGSPFPFDAALHAACAWGQRFRQIVAFPVGFRERVIITPTRRGDRYYCRILPIAPPGASVKNPLFFDIFIYTPNGSLCEDIRGVVMKDVSGGRIRPPAWVAADTVRTGAPLTTIREHSLALSLIEIKAVADFADKALTPPEYDRLATMGPKRRKDYLAGRLALKHLARILSGENATRPASDLHTLMPDGIRPCCHAPGVEATAFCSVAHDARFAVAVAGNEPIGVDVERISDRILKTRHLFMGDEEMDLTENSELGNIHASLRVWSIKEGVSKAIGREISRCWKAVAVNRIGQNQSRMTVDGIAYRAFHDTVDDHLFTLVKRADPA